MSHHAPTSAYEAPVLPYVAGAIYFVTFVLCFYYFATASPFL